MYVSSQLIDFFEFVLIGAIIACVFDFFRAYRKLKKVNTITVIIQDVIFFIIITVIIIFSLVKLLDSQIRLYIFLAVLLGCGLYFSTISKYIIKLYILFFNMSKEIISTICLPILLNLQIFQKISIFLKKIWRKCCKKFFSMISFIYRFIKNIKKDQKQQTINKNKRGFKFMKKKKELNESNKRNNKKIGMIHLFMFGFAIYFVYTLVQQQIQINKYNSQIEMYRADIESKTDLIEYYNNQKGDIQTDEYIENVARESLGYVKPYEKIFVDANK